MDELDDYFGALLKEDGEGHATASVHAEEPVKVQARAVAEHAAAPQPEEALLAAEQESTAAASMPVLPDSLVRQIEALGEPAANLFRQAVAELADQDTEQQTLPHWAGSRFQVLYFWVGGVRLAVPLSRMSGVVAAEDARLTKLPNYPDWFLGVAELNGQAQRTRVIDTAAVVNAGDPIPEAQAQASGRHILLIDSGSWGLTCDRVDDVVWLTADDVKWRRHMGRRAWHAGTVIEHLSAVLEPDEMAAMLETLA